jgi:peptidoglycan/xylan/chitin deacetylase (PgdA/CDA1 family)
MWISPEAFDNQIRWMMGIGEVVSYQRIMDFDMLAKTPLFAITFDDGWRDNYEHALPIIKNHGIDATIFLATSVLQDGALIWPEDLAIKLKNATRSNNAATIKDSLRNLAPKSFKIPYDTNVFNQLEAVIESLKLIEDSEREARISEFYASLGVGEEPLPGYMLKWEEAKEMLDAGITFGSHTHTHKICSRASANEIEQELNVSREAIRSNLGIEVDAFAYPNARYHGTEGPLLERNGFRYAFRIHNMPVTREADPFYIPRFIGNEASAEIPAYFKLRLLGAPLFSG